MAGDPSQSRTRPMLALVGGAVAIGFAPIFVRWSEVGPNATAFWRLLLAVPALWLLARQPGVPAVPGRDRGLFALAGLCFALDLIFWHASIGLTTVANATLLANLTPVLVVAWYWLVRHDRPTGRFLTGATVALAGTAGLAWGGRVPTATGSGGDALLGNLYGVLTAFAYAGYLLAVERARGRTGGFQVMLASTVVAAAVTGVVTAALGEPWWPGSGTGWLVLLGLALLVHVLGQGGIVWAVGQLPASLSSVVILIQPVVAAGLGWLWLDEALGPADILCGALVLAGVLIARRQ
jgi:drug/metabolite transporter (DMT)-like permease